MRHVTPQRGIYRTSQSFGFNFYLVAEAQIRKPVKRMAVIHIAKLYRFIRVEHRRHSTKALIPENKFIASYEKR
jgi:hypothetical protein